jgi:hypothetical protein
VLSGVSVVLHQDDRRNAAVTYAMTRDPKVRRDRKNRLLPSPGCAVSHVAQKIVLRGALTDPVHALQVEILFDAVTPATGSPPSRTVRVWPGLWLCQTTASCPLWCTDGMAPASELLW